MFLIGEGGPGLRRGASLVNFLQNGECQTRFTRNRGTGHSFSWQGKNYSVALS